MVQRFEAAETQQMFRLIAVTAAVVTSSRGPPELHHLVIANVNFSDAIYLDVVDLVVD